MNYENRDSVEEIYKWDLTKRFKTDEAWNKELDKVKKKLNEITEYKGKVLSSSDNLLNALDKKFEINTLLQKLYSYASCKHDENIEDDKYSLMLSQITSLFYDFQEKAAYLTPEILKGTKSTINKYIKLNKLNKYKFYLSDLLRQKDHRLNESEERIVSKLISTSGMNENLSNVLTNSVINFGNIEVDGEKLELLNSNYRQIITNKDREIRRKAYNMLTSKLKKYENIYGMNLISSMKTSKNLADIYNFKSVLEMDLFDSNIPNEVVTNLYEVVESRLDVYQKYFEMIRRSLVLEKLEYFDKDTELINSELTFTIEEAKMLLNKSLSILGDDYIKILNRAFDERWIDFGVYKGKTSSIYATSNYGNNPLVLTNYLGKFNDISTLAHELGHAIHFELSGTNHAHEWYTDLFTAEVASLTNEILFSNYIMQHSNDKNLKLRAIYNTLDTIQNNLFDACLEGELENRVYKLLEEGKEVNTTMLNDMMFDIRSKYYGSEVKLDKNISIMWTRRMHYFRPYYLFKYATGVSSAVYIAKKIISGDEELKEKYLKFLTKGGSNYPTELLAEMGLDLTKPEVINEAIDYMEYLINEERRISEE